MYCEIHKVYFNPETNAKCALCQLKPRIDGIKNIKKIEKAKSKRKAYKARYYKNHKKEENRKRVERRRSASLVASSNGLE